MIKQESVLTAVSSDSIRTNRKGGKKALILLGKHR